MLVLHANMGGGDDSISNNLANAIQSVQFGAQLGKIKKDSVMKVIYRIRGLMGPAIEEIIDSFMEKDEGAKTQNDDEEKYRMANVMTDNDSAGLSALLQRLDGVKHLDNRVRQLLDASLKLFSHTQAEDQPNSTV